MLHDYFKYQNQGSFWQLKRFQKTVYFRQLGEAIRLRFPQIAHFYRNLRALCCSRSDLAHYTTTTHLKTDCPCPKNAFIFKSHDHDLKAVSEFEPTQSQRPLSRSCRSKNYQLFTIVTAAGVFQHNQQFNMRIPSIDQNRNDVLLLFFILDRTKRTD